MRVPGQKQIDAGYFRRDGIGLVLVRAAPVLPRRRVSLESLMSQDDHEVTALAATQDRPVPARRLHRVPKLKSGDMRGRLPGGHVLRRQAENPYANPLNRQDDERS